MSFEINRTFFYSFLLQATLNDSFLADLDELSDNEDEILVSILQFLAKSWAFYMLAYEYGFAL